jgi:hypothetical protein
MRGSTILRAFVFPVWLGAASSACSSSSQPVLSICSIEGGIVCPDRTTCVNLSALGPDGECHGIGAVCSLPCLTASDCASMGKNAVCSTACSTVTIADGGPTMGVCTPNQ